MVKAFLWEVFSLSDVQIAAQHDFDVVLIDTAGRMQDNEVNSSFSDPGIRINS